MKIGVLYICTGKYSIFWDSFYRSSEKYFLPTLEKKYFVFTDNTTIEGSSNIYVKHATSKGFPMDSLLRFDMFLSIKDQLQDLDYVYFFNSNMQFVKLVNEEILPTEVSSGLVGVLHPGYYDESPKLYPYERNSKSTAYIKYQTLTRYKYFMGGLNGGKTEEYLKLSEECSKKIHLDLDRNIMAVYHDESHLNHYFNRKEVLELSPEYGFPEDSNIPFDPKILILNKIKHGGDYFDKLPEKALSLRFRLKLKSIYSSLIWKFQ